MLRRIFVGLPIDCALGQKILAFQNQHLDWPVRWIAQKNLHVTLVPPWQTAEIQPVIEVLKSVSVSNFSMEFNQLNLGPVPKKPRLIWALGQTPAWLTVLRNRLFAALGQVLVSKPYRPHITLARLEKSGTIGVFNKVLPQFISWRFEVGEFCLYESILNPDGADYRILSKHVLVN